MRRALDPPEGSTVVLTTDLVTQAIAASRSSPRRRVTLPLHPRNDDNLHRMFNAVQPGTYIRPHRHLSPPKAESIVLLRGSIHFVVFEDDGRVWSHVVLAAGSGSFGIDIKPGICHTFLALQPDTVLFEVKPGPYDENTDKDFASWAPAEGSEQAAEFLAALQRQLLL